MTYSVTHNLSGPVSDTCLEVHYVVIVCRGEYVWFRGLYCRPVSVQVRQSFVLLPMFSLTFEGQVLRDIPQKVCVYAATARCRNFGGRHGSLSVQTSESSKNVFLGDRIHVMSTPVLSSLTLTGVISGGI